VHDNQISRSELAEVTGLSQATISSIVSHLIQEGALVEEGAPPLAVRGPGADRSSRFVWLPTICNVAGVKIATHQIRGIANRFLPVACLASEKYLLRTSGIYRGAVGRFS